VRRLIVGVSGASGSVYAIAALRTLRAIPDVETHLVLSQQARQTIELETDTTAAEVEALADVVHRDGDLAASISSGSFKTDGMLVIPCSIKSASAIAYSFNANLLTRAADVCLKEKRRLVLVVRETPLHLGHLRTLTQLAELGAVILPPVPGMYARPKTVEEIVAHTVGKALDQFGIDAKLFRPLERRLATRVSARYQRERRADDAFCVPLIRNRLHRVRSGRNVRFNRDADRGLVRIHLDSVIVFVGIGDMLDPVALVGLIGAAERAALGDAGEAHVALLLLLRRPDDADDEQLRKLRLIFRFTRRCERGRGLRRPRDDERAHDAHDVHGFVLRLRGRVFRRRRSRVRRGQQRERCDREREPPHATASVPALVSTGRHSTRGGISRRSTRSLNWPASPISPAIVSSVRSVGSRPSERRFVFTQL
jgi:4-hydroxy-3-polyprenylbenzoate decarboxylase